MDDDGISGTHDEMPSSTATPERTNKARQRHQRRKARRQQRESAVASARRTVRQVAPARRLNLPPIDARFLRPILAGVAALIFMVMLILGVGLFKNDPVEVAPNALWLGEEWTHANNDEANITALGLRLRNNEIGSVYAWVSWLQPDNVWSGGRDASSTFTVVEPQVRTFARQFRATYPEASLYGWVRVPVGIGEDYRLDNDALIASVSAFSTQIVNVMGFDGVFLEIGPVLNGDLAYPQLLQQVRTSIGSDALLAVALPPDWTPSAEDVPRPSLLADGLEWEREYKQRIALLVDQIVVQAYNSYLESPTDYSDWVAYQVRTYAAAIADLQTGTDLLISLPVFDDAPPAHDIQVENLTSAFDGLRNGLVDAGGDATAVTGVALYADWDMDAEAWNMYKTEWVDR